MGDVHVACRDLVQHGREEKEVVTADERDVDVFAMAEPPLELTGRLNAAKATAEHDDASSSHSSPRPAWMPATFGGYTSRFDRLKPPTERHRTASMTERPGTGANTRWKVLPWHLHDLGGRLRHRAPASTFATGRLDDAPAPGACSDGPRDGADQCRPDLFAGRPPLGRAHEPAVTLTFFRLGKISAIDAGAYMGAQFLGGAAGMCIASLVFRRFAADASVNYVATMPGLKGAAWAFSAEAVISFVMMLTVLVMSNAQRLARLTGIAAGVLVATFITFEAPFRHEHEPGADRGLGAVRRR